MAYILSTKISEVAWRRCTSGVTQLERTTGKFGGSQRGRLTVRVRQRSSYPKFWRGTEGGGRQPKNSSRQFQVGLHIITSLRQRCGGPKQSDGNDCKSPKRFFQVPVRPRPPAGHLFLQKHTEDDFYECKIVRGGDNDNRFPR